jgi:hypothetical protein
MQTIDLGADAPPAAGWVLAGDRTTTLTGIGISIMVVTFPAIRAERPTPAWRSCRINKLSRSSRPCSSVRRARDRWVASACLVGTAIFTGARSSARRPPPRLTGGPHCRPSALRRGPAVNCLFISAFAPSACRWPSASGRHERRGLARPADHGIIIDHGGQALGLLDRPPHRCSVLARPVRARESVRDRTKRLPDPLGVAVMTSTSVITLGVVQRKTDEGWVAGTHAAVLRGRCCSGGSSQVPHHAQPAAAPRALPRPRGRRFRRARHRDRSLRGYWRSCSTPSPNELDYLCTPASPRARPAHLRISVLEQQGCQPLRPTTVLVIGTLGVMVSCITCGSRWAPALAHRRAAGGSVWRVERPVTPAFI